MSTPEQPGTPALTRRQMREIRNTGATPVVTPEDLAEAEAQTDARSAAEAPVITQAPVAPLPRAAEPVVVAEAPAPDASVDLGVSPLTRRQARQQERIRTASVPVITPDLLAAQAAAPAPIDAVPTGETALPAAEAEPDAAPAGSPFDQLFAPAPAVPAPAADVDETQDAAGSESDASSDASVSSESEEPFDATVSSASVASESEAPADEHDEAPSVADLGIEASADTGERAVVSSQLGAGLLTAEPTSVTLPPTFDQLLSHSTSGSTATPNALIVSQTTGAPLVGPVAATGEVLITGTFNLPEGLGSLGHTPRTADGREADAVLVDGELPAHSSPTPIAASAAISTVKTSGEIIKPPAPEKGNKLMISLAITAGALAAALLAVLAIALISGVF